MKKLMIAAGLCATVLGAQAQLTSSNIVGYQNQTANATRNTMMAPTFLTVNSTTGCTLADLKVTGYGAYDPEEGEGGCQGEFVLYLLNNDGSNAGTYFWLDEGEDITAGWYATAGGKAIAGGASSVTIPAGTAAWVYGSGYQLVAAGAVGTADIAFKMNDERNTACGNCTPVDLTLADFTVSGYGAYDPEEGEGGCQGEFVLYLLNNDGSNAGTYYWLDEGEDITAGWYATAGGKAIEGGAASVSMPAGKGAWVYGSGYTLNIPAPKLSK